MARLSLVLKWKTDTVGNELVAPGNNVGKQSFSTGVSSKNYKKNTDTESYLPVCWQKCKEMEKAGMRDWQTERERQLFMFLDKREIIVLCKHD